MIKYLNQYHFWYGAILNTIIECNEDAIPTLLEATDKRGIYKILTNTSNREYIIFCKHAFQKSNKSSNYKSWLFSFSEEDKQRLEEYYNQNYPVFICMLCALDDLKGSEIAICTYEEFSTVKDKRSITIGKQKGKPYFNLYTEKQRNTSIPLNRNRITRKSDDIIDELINFSPEHYKVQIKQKIKLNVQNVNSKKYEKAISGQAIRYLSLNYRDDNICPIHNIKMPPIFVHIGSLKDTAYYCEKCGKYMIPTTRYEKLIKNLGKYKRSIEFEVIID